MSRLGAEALVIRLGVAPEVEAPPLGDVNAMRDLPLYRSLAALYAPHLKVPRIRYLPDPDDPFTIEEQTRWHQRFL